MILRKTQQLGVGLIEVLVAIFVVALVTLSVMQLQGTILSSGSDARARSAAIKLAQRKLDDLKSFKCLEDDSSDDSDPESEQDCPKASGQYPFTYVEIAGTNAGGTKLQDGSNALKFPSGDVTIGNTTYTVNWEAVDYYYCDDAMAPSTSNCTPAKSRPSFKDVEVAVAWNDENGDQQQVSVKGAIAAKSPLAIAELGAPADTAVPPVIEYEPLDAPDVIAVPVELVGGTGAKYKETSKPLPRVQTGSGGNVRVSFDVVTYEPNTDGGFDTLTREQFVTVSCDCNFTSTSSGNGWTPFYTDLEAGELAMQSGEFLIGQKGAGEEANNQQLEYCDVCCRDHHDKPSSSDYPPYDPLRAIAHAHYKSNGSGGFVQVNNTSNAYLESCRLLRVNGHMRVLPDWQLLDTIAMPRNYLTSSTNLGTYISWVRTRIENEVRDRRNNTTTATTKPTGRDLSSNTGATYQSLSRTIYMDDMDTDHLETVYQKIINNEDDWLALVPFYEINTTLLSHWDSLLLSVAGSGVPGTATGIGTATVTDEDVATITRYDPVTGSSYLEDYYSRGLVVTASGVLVNPSAFIVSYSKNSNTGLASTDPIDSGDTATTADEYLLTVVSGIAVSGTFDTTPSSFNGSDLNDIVNNVNLSVSGVSPCSGNSDIVFKTSNVVSYCFEVTSGWSGTVSPTLSGFTFCTQSGASSRTYSGITAGQSGQDFCVVESGSCPASGQACTP